MYKRVLTAVAAAIIAALLMLTLGTLGINGAVDAQHHVIAHVS